eukprot:GHVU01229494.1.p1 GENE.GHVU01229494.1~~GHVU01229494.1.p1  ORF type:complete len:280 (-),score=35.63 GHVU01229494.1:1581-2420(-)
MTKGGVEENEDEEEKEEDDDEEEDSEEDVDYGKEDNDAAITPSTHAPAAGVDPATPKDAHSSRRCAEEAEHAAALIVPIRAVSADGAFLTPGRMLSLILQLLLLLCLAMMTRLLLAVATRACCCCSTGCSSASTVGIQSSTTRCAHSRAALRSHSSMDPWSASISRACRASTCCPSFNCCTAAALLAAASGALFLIADIDAAPVAAITFELAGAVPLLCSRVRRIGLRFIHCRWARNVCKTEYRCLFLPGAACRYPCSLPAYWYAERQATEECERQTQI